MQKSFPKRLEEQVARLSAYMSLPEPASGNTFLRLIRLPARGRETVVDLSSCGFRFRLRVTRFLKSLRQNFLHHDSSGNEPLQTVTVAAKNSFKIQLGRVHEGWGVSTRCQNVKNIGYSGIFFFRDSRF